MKQLLTILLVLFTSFCFSQTTIKLDDVSQHVGDSVTVVGKVYGGRFLANSGGKPTLLNLGAAFLNQLLTLVVWGKDRSAFVFPPETTYLDKDVVVRGKIELYKGKPQVVLHSDKQITVVGTAALIEK